MQVVSGRPGKQRIHFEAPPADRVEAEMSRFLEWWQASPGALDGVLRAAVAHIWFVTIHPFEDGNGRIARAITDMALAQDERIAARFYSMSAQIGANRDVYFEQLERTQRGDGDLTGWLLWFLECLDSSVASSETRLESVLAKARFWQKHALTALNERQRKVVNRMVDSGPAGFVGGLTTRKYVAMARASRATAQREISDLVEKGVLRKRSAGGRSTSYEIVWEDRR
jgi:Fic family protein